MNLVGEPISAPQAFELGLANEVVPDHEMFDTALAWARKLAGLRLRHQGGLTVRFYCTHFTPNKSGSRKNIRQPFSASTSSRSAL